MADPNAAGETLNLRQMLGQAVRRAVDLQVITMVGDVVVTDNGNAPTVASPATGPAVVTRINLLEGDIATYISPAMTTGDLMEVKVFHDSMVAKAEGIAERNIRLLKDLIASGFETLGGVTERRQPPQPLSSRGNDS